MPKRSVFSSLRTRFLVVLVLLGLLILVIMGYVSGVVFPDLAEEGPRMALLAGVLVLSLGFFTILFRDIVLPLQRMTRQLLQAAREPERIGAFVNAGEQGDTEVGAAQAALNQLFLRVEDTMRSLKQTNADAARRLAAIEASHDGVCMVDAKGELTYANQTFRSVHGLDEGGTGMAWVSLYDARAQEKLKKSCLVMLVEDGFWNGEIETGDRVFELALTMLDDGGFIGNERDITSRRKVETEKDQLQGLFVQAQKMEAVGRLTGGVAHDFNNMLAVILGNLELVEDDLPNDDNLKRFVAAAQRAAHRGAELTQRLLSFSRRQVLTPKVVTPAEFMDDALTLISRVVNEKIKMDVRVPGDLWAMNVDVGQLENALLNLTINARDAMPDGGTIAIHAENVILDETEAEKYDVSAGGYVRLCLDDTGQGIPPEILDRVFEPFFTTKGMGQGTGLGLSMVYGFARQSGGFVDIESVPGRGTSIRIYLPRHETESGTQDAARPVRMEQKARRMGTIVLAEDDEDVLEMTEQRLKRMGYAVHLARSGDDALEVMRRLKDVDLLLTDVAMPGMDGVTLAGKAREMFPGLKILFLSGHVQDKDMLRGFPEGSVRYLAKPYTQQKLAEEIEALAA